MNIFPHAFTKRFAVIHDPHMFPQWIKIRAETWIETSEVTIIIQIDIALIWMCVYQFVPLQFLSLIFNPMLLSSQSKTSRNRWSASCYILNTFLLLLVEKKQIVFQDFRHMSIKNETFSQLEMAKAEVKKGRWNLMFRENRCKHRLFVYRETALIGDAWRRR